MNRKTLSDENGKEEKSIITAQVYCIWIPRWLLLISFGSIIKELKRQCDEEVRKRRAGRDLNS